MLISIWIIFTIAIGYLIFKKIFTKEKSKPCLNFEEDFEYDVAIVGSGILGSSLAAVLGRDGRRVVVVERDMNMPDRIVGELLQPGGCKALKNLGLEDCLEDIEAQDIFGYLLHYKKIDQIIFDYPFDADGIPGKAFQHGRFVMNLRNAAKASSNVTYIEATVKNLLENNDVVTGIIYRTKDNKEHKLKAKLTVVADGCFSKLRKSLVNGVPEQLSTIAGLILHGCPCKSKFSEVVITDNGPLLLYQISDQLTRLFIFLRGQKLPKNLREFLKDEIHHQIPEHLQDSFLDAVHNGPIKSMPNCFLPPSPIYRKGALVLGDAFNMRHPITGGGMTVAFEDIIIFRELISSVKDLSDYNTLYKISKILYSKRKRNYSFVVNVLSVILYQMFSGTDKWLKLLQKSLFLYIKRGGACSTEPIELLSVLKPSPYVFMTHLISVFVYAVYISFKTRPMSKFYQSCYESIRIFMKACSISLPFIWAEAKTMIL